MLHRVLKKFGQKAHHHLSKSAACPRCVEVGRRVTGETYTCDSCGFVGAPPEWQSTTGPTGKVGQIPPDTKITRRDLTTGGVVFMIPASGRSGGMLGFGIVWLSFTALVTLLLIIASFLGKVESDIDAAPWLLGLGMTLFSALFWMVGIGLIYFGLRAKLAKHVIRLENGQIDYVREFGRKRKHTIMAYEDVSSITATVFYTRNYQPVYGIEIRDANNKARFGTTLTDSEKGWLVAEFNAIVFSGPDSNSLPPTQEDRASTTRKRRFDLVLQPQPKRAVGFISGLVAVLFVSALFALGVSPLMADAPFIFRAIWLGIISFIAVIMVSGGIWSMWNSRKTTRVIFNGQKVTVRMERARAAIAEVSVPIEDVLRIAAYQSGAMNDQDRFDGALITADRLIKLYRWRTADLTEDFMNKLRQGLDLPS